jgi:hypothetical protein
VPTLRYSAALCVANFFILKANLSLHLCIGVLISGSATLCVKLEDQYFFGLISYLTDKTVDAQLFLQRQGVGHIKYIATLL